MSAIRVSVPTAGVAYAVRAGRALSLGDILKQTPRDVEKTKFFSKCMEFKAGKTAEFKELVKELVPFASSAAKILAEIVPEVAQVQLELHARFKELAGEFSTSAFPLWSNLAVYMLHPRSTSCSAGNRDADGELGLALHRDVLDALLCASPDVADAVLTQALQQMKDVHGAHRALSAVTCSMGLTASGSPQQGELKIVAGNTRDASMPRTCQECLCLIDSNEALVQTLWCAPTRARHLLRRPSAKRATCSRCVRNARVSCHPRTRTPMPNSGTD